MIRTKLEPVLTLALALAAPGGPARGQESAPESPAPATPAVSFADIELSDEPTPLLAGHLVVRLPRGAIIEGRAHNIMSAPEAEALETRAVLDVGDRRLVVLANELSRSDPGPELQAAIRAHFEDDPARGEALVLSEHAADRGETRIVTVVVPEVEASAQAILVTGAIVVHPDGTLQRLCVYVNDAALDDLAGARALGDRVTASLQSGPRRLTRQPATVELSRDDSRSLMLDVPGDVLRGLQQGPDFWVHRFTTIVPLGQVPASLGLYEGGWPQQPPESAQRSRITLCGREAWWELTEEVEGADTWYRADMLVTHPLHASAPPPPPPSGEGDILPPPPEEFPEFLHVFVAARSAAERERLMQVVQTLRVVDGGPAAGR